jgi:hypothetical protein
MALDTRAGVYFIHLRIFNCKDLAESSETGLLTTSIELHDFIEQQHYLHHQVRSI